MNWPSVIQKVSPDLASRRKAVFGLLSKRQQKHIRKLWSDFERLDKKATKANKVFWKYANKVGIE